MNLNEINSRSDLAHIIHIPESKLTYLLYITGIDNCYTEFEIPKKNGGVRKIESPNKDLRIVLKRLSDALLLVKNKADKESGVRENIAQAFTKKRGIITNARIHRNKRFVVNLDLKDYFTSFHFGRVLGYFEKNKNFVLPHNMAVILAQLTCYQGHLPQGAPSSPIITNMIGRMLDLHLLEITRKYRLDYTRYADDLTFSTNVKSFLEKKMHF
ncbi:RNA-directed DNA polymerase [Lactobacillus brevis] [Lactiplantibacillus mudanjiangensis]|uniref:reverse transcriptase domain-containing protein n=1 Tax=Lactiplantibacillus mudanjiangensis TaxID=1296538 RepID=UPI00101453A8|nr:RNA-directed DNA polymerase [Lactobacillus brevis] [Lactiplantibacillus mudanjiangensis]